MEENQAKVNSTAKILVPILIVVAVLLVWAYKNMGAVGPAATGEESNPDFELYATADMDLDSLFEYNLPVILDFGASWCGPCQLMKPTLVKLNEELKGQAIIKYVDVDEMDDFASGYPVTVVPTQFFYTPGGQPFMPSEDFLIPMKMYEYKESGELALTAHEGYLDEQEILQLLEAMGMNQEAGE